MRMKLTYVNTAWHIVDGQLNKQAMINFTIPFPSADSAITSYMT